MCRWRKRVGRHRDEAVGAISLPLHKLASRRRHGAVDASCSRLRRFARARSTRPTTLSTLLLEEQRYGVSTSRDLRFAESAPRQPLSDHETPVDIDQQQNAHSGCVRRRSRSREFYRSNDETGSGRRTSHAPRSFHVPRHEEGAERFRSAPLSCLLGRTHDLLGATSPACGGGRREAPGGGSLLSGSLSVDTPPPRPPPQAGEGAHFLRGCHLIQLRRAWVRPLA